MSGRAGARRPVVALALAAACAVLSGSCDDRTGPAPPRAPAAPGSLAAEALSGTLVALSWSDGSDNETGFRVERCAGGGCGGFAVIASLGANSTGYQDPGVEPGTTYRYRVQAFNDVGASAYSNAVTVATPAPPPAPPAAPSGLTATAVSSSRIDLAWTDHSGGAAGFRIERCVSGECDAFAEIASTAAGVTGYEDAGLEPSTTYRYRVRASSEAGDSDYSNIAAATTDDPPPDPPAPPAAPSDLEASAASGTTVELAWTDNSGDETGFRIERCAGSGCDEFDQVATVGADVTAHLDTGLEPSTTYRYRVRAFNEAGDSEPSNTAEATTPATPAEPFIELSATTVAFAAVEGGSDPPEQTVEVTNGGGGDLDGLSVGVTHGDGEPAGWLAASLSDGAAPSTLTLAASPADLPPHSYSAVVEISAAVAINSPRAVTVTLVVSEFGAYVLYAQVSPDSPYPGGVVTVAPDQPEYAAGTEVELTATANPGFRFIQWSGALGPVQTSDNPITLVMDADRTAIANFALLAPELDAPTAAEGPFTLSWTLEWPCGSPCLMSSQDYYVLEQSTTSASDGFEVVWTSPNTRQSPYTVELERPAGTYHYRVRAHVGQMPAFTPYSEVRTVAVSGPEPTLPAAPTGLAATAVSSSAVDLAWTDNSDDETGFRIERCTGDGCADFAEIATVGADVTAHGDAGLEASTTYRYRVRAFNDAGDSDYSNIAAAATPASLAPASIQLSTGSLAFESSQGGPDPAPAAVAVSNGGEVELTGLTAQVGYPEGEAFGWLSATLDGTEAPAVVTVQASTGALAEGEYQATVLVGSPVADNSPQEVAVTFAVGPAARHTLTVTSSPLAGGSVTRDPEAADYAAGTQVSVQAHPSSGYRFTDWSGDLASSDNPASVLVDRDLSVTAGFGLRPPVLSGPSNAGATFTLSWTQEWTESTGLASTNDGFYIEQSTTSVDDGFSQIAFQPETTRPATGSITLTRDPGTYHYRVRSLMTPPGTFTPRSNVVTVTVTEGGPGTPAAPSSLTVTTDGLGILVRWTNNATNADGLELDASLTSDFADYDRFQLPPDWDGVNFVAHHPYTTFYFRVRAYNSAGASAFSNTGSGTTGDPEFRYYATADNGLLYATEDPNPANTVYPLGLLHVGYVFQPIGHPDVGFYTAWVAASAAIRFQGLESLLAGRTIASAVLRLQPWAVQSQASTYYAASAFASGWSPATITYNNQPQYFLAGVAQVLQPTNHVFPLEFNITEIVTRWANGSWTNNGILVRDTYSSLPSSYLETTTEFISEDDYADPVTRPHIHIQVVTPAGFQTAGAGRTGLVPVP